MPYHHASTTVSGFQRVTRQQPCLICAKPDWCSRTADWRFSICMRIRDGAVKINQHGGAIFVHQETSLSLIEPSLPIQPPEPLASLEIRDFFYRHLIRLSPVTRYHRALVGGTHGLLARGLRAEHLDNYGSLPPRVVERDKLARELRSITQQQFPVMDSLGGVPGCWEDERGIHLGQSYNARHPWLLIPVRDGAGLIQACQLRHAGWSKGAKYCWLSSAGLPNGVGSGSPLHFTFHLDALPKDAPITIVEGILKADVLAALRLDLHVIGIGGVSVSHGAVIQATRQRHVVVGFDQDYRQNEQVCWQLAALLAARVASEGTDETTRIAVWPPRVKGIDDAALSGLPITTLSLTDWWRSLSPSLQTVVRNLWHARGSSLLLSL